MFFKKLKDKKKLHQEQNRLAQENWDENFRNCSIGIKWKINDLIRGIHPELAYLIDRK